jgi:Ser/Thr protein kinase RdoA (MazF antagonist)
VDVPGGERYVLRTHRTADNPWHPVRTYDHVRSEMAWLAALRRDTDLVVPDPVQTLDGSLLTVAEAEHVPTPRICVLFRWVEGRFIDKGLTPAHLEWVGALMGRLQMHAMSFERAEWFVRSRVDSMGPGVGAAIVRVFADVYPPEDVWVVAEIIARVTGVLNALGEGADTFGLIHADLHQENYLFHRGEARAIDFDDCGYGNFLYDLAVTLSNLEHSPLYGVLYAALLKGYRSVRSLPEEHESYLPTLMELRRLQIAVVTVSERTHPAFRDSWQADIAYDLGKMRDFLARERG